MSDETAAGTGTVVTSGAGSSPASTGAMETPSASATQTSATATAAPISPTAPHDPNGSGEPPKERWADILSNTRTKTRGEVEAEFRQKYGWADAFQTNPLEFMRTWNGQMLAHPEYGPQWRAEVARTLRGMRQQTPEVSEEPAPDVPVVDAQGNTVSHAYSAPQMKKWQDWQWAQREASLNEKFAPLESMRTQIEQAQQVAQIQQQAAHHAQSTLETLRANPYFVEHEGKIKQALAENEAFGDNVYQAFVHVLSTQVLPGLSQTEQAKVVASLQQKAAASTVSASGQTATSKPKFKDFAEASRYYAEHPAEAAAMANR